MKQLLVISGKGGTGKTTLSAAFAQLSQARAVADCDVDAPNLHLVLPASSAPETIPFYGMDVAHITPELCLQCGRCMELCRFGAISHVNGEYRVDTNSCEGCGVCEATCPSFAINLLQDQAGSLMLHRTPERVFSTAQLKMGKGNSGLLVSAVKRRLHEAAPEETLLAIIDGSPGIGCPVIASLNGVDLALVVAEPSQSGISDLKRLVATAKKSAVPLAVCVNKYDTGPIYTGCIETFCKEQSIPFAGVIPFDPMAARTVNSGKSIVDVDCPAGDAIRQVFYAVIALLGGPVTGRVDSC